MSVFKLHSPFSPAGDQKKAIKALSKVRPEVSTLMGVTGSGKTYTIANVIANQSKPVLVLSPNKTLAAQLYEEFYQFFPKNKVCYFVSYYDYYQPESYLPAQDIYIEKETKVNSELERLRVETTASIINRKDVIVIASVSCIYSLGNPYDYRDLAFSLKVGDKISRIDLIRKLISIQYKRNDVERSSGTFQVFGSTVEVNLPYQKEKLRVELFGGVIENMEWVDRQDNQVLATLDNTLIFPAKHFVTTDEKKESAIRSIRAELEDHLPTLTIPHYKERLRSRVNHDLELLKERGFCSGIENYSSHFENRKSGEPPYCLFDFFKDFLLIVDESHIAIPQLRGMYLGDRARKTNLVNFGFRLPSALDNRPLKFEETEKFFKDAIFLSATPGEYELSKSGAIVEQIIRPTGLVDPEIKIHGREGQLTHLISQVKNTAKKGFRTLVTVLTKKLAEELARYLEERGIKVCYLHCDLKTPERTELLHKLRAGIFDCLVGVNLLREGLDLPEVALVAIMDADIAGFLRDKRSLIQTIGRAARNSESFVLMYADRITESMKAAIDETNRRRAIQILHNKINGIIPKTVQREVTASISNLQKAIGAASKFGKKKGKGKEKKNKAISSQKSINKELKKLELLMQKAADNLEFEKAIELRGEWQELKGLVT